MGNYCCTPEIEEKEEIMEWPAFKCKLKRKGRHLIVDDSKENRSIMNRYLAKSNIKSDECINGQLAIDMVQTNDYDCIWMDIRMPTMNGIDASKHIREVGYDGVIIALTGQIDKETIKMCKEVGVNYVLAKPVEKEVLLSLLERFCLTLN